MKHWPNKTTKRFYGAVITVADLETCRAFYRDVLGLGPPVVDSSFWVEFEVVPGQMVLALWHRPQNERDNTHVGESHTAWCLEVADCDELTSRLEQHGRSPTGSTTLPNGARTLTFQDPEGNPFVVLQKPDL